MDQACSFAERFLRHRRGAAALMNLLLPLGISSLRSSDSRTCLRAPCCYRSPIGEACTATDDDPMSLRRKREAAT